MEGVNGRVVIHTDGACLGNPGPGGWAAILRSGAAERELSAQRPSPRTTEWS